MFNVTGQILHMNEIRTMNINNFLKRSKCEDKKMHVPQVLHISTLHNQKKKKKFCDANSMYYCHSISILWNVTLHENNHWYLKFWIMGKHVTFVCVFLHVYLITQLITICLLHSNSLWIMILYNQTSHKIM